MENPITWLINFFSPWWVKVLFVVGIIYLFLRISGKIHLPGDEKLGKSGSNSSSYNYGRR